MFTTRATGYDNRNENMVRVCSNNSKRVLLNYQSVLQIIVYNSTIKSGGVGAKSCLATCRTKERTYVITATYYKINWRNITYHCSRGVGRICKCDGVTIRFFFCVYRLYHMVLQFVRLGSYNWSKIRFRWTGKQINRAYKKNRSEYDLQHAVRSIMS